MRHWRSVFCILCLVVFSTPLANAKILMLSKEISLPLQLLRCAPGDTTRCAVDGNRASGVPAARPWCGTLERESTTVVTGIAVLRPTTFFSIYAHWRRPYAASSRRALQA